MLPTAYSEWSATIDVIFDLDAARQRPRGLSMGGGTFTCCVKECTLYCYFISQRKSQVGKLQAGFLINLGNYRVGLSAAWRRHDA